MSDTYGAQELPVLARYGPRTALALQRSQYLVRALQEMQQGGQNIKGGIGELAARLIGEYLAAGAFKKANAGLGSAMQADQTEANAPVEQVFNSLPGGSGAPVAPAQPPQAPVVPPTPPAPPAAPTPSAMPMPGGSPIGPAQIAQAESRNNPSAISPAGAMGRMQVMPGTAASPGFGVAPARDNSDAELTRVGSDYWNAMLQRYGGDPLKAAVAYNWGPGHADRWAASGGNIGALPHETQGYLARLGLLGGPAQNLGAPVTFTGVPPQGPPPQPVAQDGEPPPPPVQQIAMNGPPQGAPPQAALPQPPMPQQGAPQSSGWGPTPQERTLVQSYLSSPNYMTHQQGIALMQKLNEKYSAPPGYEQHIDPGTGQVMYAPVDPRAGAPFAANIPGYRAPLPPGMTYDGNPAPAQRIPGTGVQMITGGPPGTYGTLNQATGEVTWKEVPHGQESGRQWTPQGYQPIPGLQFQNVPGPPNAYTQVAPTGEIVSKANPGFGPVPSGMNLTGQGAPNPGSPPGAAGTPNVPGAPAGAASAPHLQQIPNALPVDQKLGMTEKFISTKQYQEYREASVALNALKTLATQRTGPSTFAAFDNYVRGSNPGGIARPQMLNMAQELFGKQSEIYTAIQSWVNKDGATLPPNIMNAMINAMGGMAQARYQALQPQIEAYSYIAKRNGLDPAEIMPNVIPPGQEPSQSPRASGWSQSLPAPQLQAARGFAGSTGAHGSRTNPLVPRNAAEFNSIRSGQWYIDTDGAVVQKGAQ